MAGFFSQSLLLTKQNAGEILDSRSDFRCPTVAPGQIPGALRFVSLALHVLPHRVKGSAGLFQRGSFRTLHRDPKTHFQKLCCQISACLHRISSSPQQAWMYSRNPSNIASVCKQRQPAISNSDTWQQKCRCRGWRIRPREGFDRKPRTRFCTDSCPAPENLSIPSRHPIFGTGAVRA